MSRLAAVAQFIAQHGLSFKHKTFMGTDCPGFNLTITRGKKTVAFFVDDGGGGSVMGRWSDKELEKAAVDFIAAQPEIDINQSGVLGKGRGPMMHKYEVDFFATDLLNYVEISKLPASKTHFTNGSKDVTFNHPPTPEFIASKREEMAKEGLVESHELLGLPLPSADDIKVEAMKAVAKKPIGKTFFTDGNQELYFNHPPTPEFIASKKEEMAKKGLVEVHDFFGLPRPSAIAIRAEIMKQAAKGLRSGTLTCVLNGLIMKFTCRNVNDAVRAKLTAQYPGVEILA